MWAIALVLACRPGTGKSDPRDDTAVSTGDTGATATEDTSLAPGIDPVADGDPSAGGVGGGGRPVYLGDVDGGGRRNLLLLPSADVVLLLHGEGVHGDDVSGAVTTLATDAEWGSVWPLGNLDGDGISDLYIRGGGISSATLYTGATLDDPSPTWTFASHEEPSALGDVDGDGWPDIAAVRPATTPTVQIISGQGALPAGAVSSDTTVESEKLPSERGLDFDGDGLGDVLGYTEKGYGVFPIVYSGADLVPGGALNKRDATWMFTDFGDDPYHLGRADLIGPIGDATGDGLEDIGVRVCLDRGCDAPAVDIVAGGTAPGDVDVDATAIAKLGFDTYPDWLVHGDDAFPVLIGGCGLPADAISGNVDASACAFTLADDWTSTVFGQSLDDLDGDGRPDLAVDHAKDDAIWLVPLPG